MKKAGSWYSVINGARFRRPGASAPTTPPVGGGGSPTYPYPTFTDRPIVRYQDVYRVGDSVSDVLANRLPSTGCYVTLPDGFDGEIVDFQQGGQVYGVYAPRCYGIWGSNPDQARIRMRANSSTMGAKVPTQAQGGINPLTAMRIGPGSSAVQPQVHMYGITLEGAELGHPWNGLVAYWNGPGSTYTNLKLKGFGLGNWNSPPGETNMFNAYLGSGVLLEGVEASGLRSDGVRAGCAFASNGTNGITYRDCYVHDALVSGTTFGTAGSVTTGTLTRNIRTYNLKTWFNANHSNAGGMRFGGINHEGGFDIEHHYPDIFIRQSPYGNKEHIAINGSQANSRLLVNEPNWHREEGGSPSFAFGCFVISIDASYINQKQDASMITVIKDGVTLTPVTRAQASTSDPARNYVLLSTSV